MYTLAGGLSSFPKRLREGVLEWKRRTREFARELFNNSIEKSVCFGGCIVDAKALDGRGGSFVLGHCGECVDGRYERMCELRRSIRSVDCWFAVVPDQLPRRSRTEVRLSGEDPLGLRNRASSK